MLRKKFSIGMATLVVAISVMVMPMALAAPAQQTLETLTIGVIGPFNGPTAEGVSLAVKRVSAQGVFTTPDGVSHKLATLAIDASTPQQVTDALNTFKQNKVVAIFAPNDDQLIVDSMTALQAANVPVFTGATGTIVKGGGLIFRTRAADTWRMGDLADYMLTDLKKTTFAIYQGSGDTAGAIHELVGALTQRGKVPAAPFVPAANAKVADSAQTLIASAADAIVAFGGITETADLYRALKAANYKGIFATPNAAQPAFVDALPESLRAGIYGVTGWSYSAEDTDSVDFLRDYVALFGNMPIGLSASAYDSAVALLIAIKNSGTTPDGIRTAILKLAAAKSIEGIFNPGLGNNDLSASVSITVTNRYGASELVARYENTGRVNVSTVVPTPYPAATLTPSPTPVGVGGTMLSIVNVRSGPGENYPIIGALNKGEQQQFIGASADFRWYVIDFRQQQGWLSANFVSVFGNVRGLPVIPAPPTPIPTLAPPPTATALPAPFADLVMVSAVLNPQTPKSGQPFVLSVTVLNQGRSDAGQFAVATSFMPGNVYSAATINGLAAGAQTTVNLSGTVNGSGNFSITIVLDLNNQVNEGPTGKANNKPQFNYNVSP